MGGALGGSIGTGEREKEGERGEEGCGAGEGGPTPTHPPPSPHPPFPPSGALYGTYEAFRYKVPGLYKLRYVGQTTLSSAALFGLFLGAGSLLHCGRGQGY